MLRWHLIRNPYTLPPSISSEWYALLSAGICGIALAFINKFGAKFRLNMQIMRAHNTCTNGGVLIQIRGRRQLIRTHITAIRLIFQLHFPFSFPFHGKLWMLSMPNWIFSHRSIAFWNVEISLIIYALVLLLLDWLAGWLVERHQCQYIFCATQLNCSRFEMHIIIFREYGMNSVFDGKNRNPTALPMGLLLSGKRT